MPKQIYIYEAQYDFKPSEPSSDPDDEEIQIQMGDILEVDGPVQNHEKPDTWLKGKNVTKGTAGLFPGTFVKFVKIIEQDDEPPTGLCCMDIDSVFEFLKKYF